MVGKEILGYRVDEKIGSGGFGTVYKVSKTNVAGTYVRALKHITLPTKKQYASVLNSMGGSYEKADDYFAGVLQDIVNEIRILSDLSESGIVNIVRYYENDIVETQSPKSYDIYILMEYLTPFPDYCDSKPFTVRDVLRLGRDILTALISCHGKHIIHRDIKDDNIFVSPDGIYKLGDFGVSKALKDKSRAESVKGTPNFIAPEVYLGKEKYDHTVDLYSLGIVLYKLLNKARNPFLPAFPAAYSTDDEDAAFEARMTGQTPDLPYSAQNALGEAVVKAILPRADRYNSAEEFLEALNSSAATLDEDALDAVVNVVIPIPPPSTLDSAASQNTAGQSTMGNTASRPRSIADETVGGDSFVSPKNQTAADGEDRDLFRTVGTPVVPPPPPPAYGQRSERMNSNNSDNTSYNGGNSSYNYDSGKQSPPPSYNPPPYSPPPSYQPGPPQVRAVTKKSMNWLIYLSPLIILLIYVGLFHFVVTNIYDRAISLTTWLFSGPGVIMDILYAVADPYTFLKPIYMVILLKVLCWLLSGAFIGSLFWVGYTIQNKKPAIDMNAVFANKEAYLYTMGLLEQIKGINDPAAAPARRAVQELCERLRNESAFGSGSGAVINCENEIAYCLKQIDAHIPGLRSAQSVAEATAHIEQLCGQIAGKLRIRIELKKR